MARRRSRTEHPSPCPGYAWDRDNQWTRNSSAILWFIGGGDIEYFDGKWLLYRVPPVKVLGVGKGIPRQPSGLGVFGRYPCRPYPHVPTETDKRSEPDRAA